MELDPKREWKGTFRMNGGEVSIQHQEEKKSLPISFADDRPHAIDIFVCVRREDREREKNGNI